MDDVRKLQAVFQTLADYNRLQIIRSIAEKECSVGELVSAIKLSQPLVSHHLKVLKDHGVLETKRKGPFIFYSIKDLKILYAIDLFQEIFMDLQTNNGNDSRFCSMKIFQKFNQIK